MSRFLAEYACHNKAGAGYASASLRAWMTSETGISRREDLTVILCETENAGTMVSCMAALALYARTARTDGGGAGASVADVASREKSYFAQFTTSCAHRSVHGNMASTATLWKPEPMAASLWRAISALHSSSVPIVALRWLSSIADMPTARHGSLIDCIYDYYWQQRLMGQTHSASLAVMANQIPVACDTLQSLAATGTNYQPDLTGSASKR